MLIGSKKLDAAVEEASKVFWESVEKQFPEFGAEHLDHGTVIVLQWQMKEALTRYIQANLVAQENKRTPD